MEVMGWLTRPYSLPYSIGLPYSYTTPSCTRPTSIILYMMQFDCHVSSDAILLDLKCHLVAVLSVAKVQQSISSLMLLVECFKCTLNSYTH